MLQGDTLAQYPFIISLDYMRRSSIDLMKENSFKLTKERSWRYPTQTIADTGYADDIALLANTPTQTESQLYCPERAAGGISPHVNTDKTEYTYFNQSGNMFTYLGSNVSSTENDINMWLTKAWTAIDKLSVIWKSDLTNKIKRSFSMQRSCWYCYMDVPN